MSQRFAAQFTRPTVRVLILLLVVAFAATGCRNKKDKAQESRPVEAIYSEAHTDMTRNNWSGAEKQFQSLVAQYPYGTYTEQAQMELAYAQFKAGKMDEAISSIDRFLRTYPTQRNVPYMYYLRGIVNSNRDTVFLQKVWSLDSSRRDLSTPFQGYSDFNTVSERYPNSRYANDARLRMIKLRNTFARHEMDSALYYLHRGAYTAAIARAKYILETYPQSEYQYDAVAALGVAYTKLGNQTLADDARRVLQMNDPQHPWLTGHWPDYPMTIRKLNPFSGEKSALDNEPGEKASKK